jgi:hypothetical protein
MTEYVIQSVDVVSVAKILGIIGLLWGIVLALSWVVLGGPIGGRPGLPELLVAVVGSALYGVLGGALTAIVYNLAAALVGGLKFDVS